jgi:hypothetical protein
MTPKGKEFALSPKSKWRLNFNNDMGLVLTQQLEGMVQYGHSLTRVHKT